MKKDHQIDRDGYIGVCDGSGFHRILIDKNKQAGTYAVLEKNPDKLPMGVSDVQLLGW